MPAMDLTVPFFAQCCASGMTLSVGAVSGLLCAPMRAVMSFKGRSLFNYLWVRWEGAPLHSEETMLNYRGLEFLVGRGGTVSSATI